METDNTMEILSYLRNDMLPEERTAFETRMEADPSLESSVEKIEDTMAFIALWEPPPLKTDISQRVMDTLRNRERRSLNSWENRFLALLRTHFTIKRLTPALALVSLVLVSLFFLPWQERFVRQPDVAIKGEIKMMIGQRLPMATLLMEAEKIEVGKIVGYLNRAGVAVVHTEVYDTGVVVRVRNTEKVDLKVKLVGFGRLVRQNPTHLDDEGLTVIVIRKK